MTPAMRAYSGAPVNVPDITVYTQTDTMALNADADGATGAEFANSRLASFLSDDPAPRDRDLDSLFSSDRLSPYDGLPATPSADNAIRAEVPPAPAPEAMDPITLPPLESLLNAQMTQPVREDAPDTTFRGMSSGSFAQEMYTNTQDVLSRIAS
ncbi:MULTISPECIES: hypothetical protein [unclassified Epibacterium]|uniref:hypothetical protein n=1 Tax=unclassified Epibacterium TaxID=2639179 RepID=UPI001EF5B11D|nr:MULTISPECIES: hypothetical protein [unclassified Epibacterium]MCG7625686.1 hypothetical protein [Epibacterium sp. Ofav1-8]MCG7628061.1 hypothetical protein [Epibacterium sp. MM17-32]